MYRTLFSCSHDRSVKVWNVDEMAYVETLFGHQDRITGVDAGVRERAVTSGGRDGTVRVWKIVEESQLVFNGKAVPKCRLQINYRVAHLLANLGWVDLDLGSSLGWWPLL